jgi:hypothetical protein
MGADLILIAGIFVHMRRSQHVKALDASGHRNRTTNLCASALGGLNDLLGRLINQTMIKRFQANADSLVSHTSNSKPKNKKASSPVMENSEKPINYNAKNYALAVKTARLVSGWRIIAQPPDHCKHFVQKTATT